HAFHSPLMDPILAELENAIADFRTMPPKIPTISNVTGDLHGDAVPASYWCTHVRKPVLFQAGLQRVLRAACTELVEVGPHPALTPAVSATIDPTRARCVP